MVFVERWPFFHVFFFRKYRPAKYVLRYSRAKKTPFSAIKTRSQKSRKINIFPQSLTHGFGQKWPFLQPFFQEIQARKLSFTIFQSGKKPFQAIKTRSSKNRKIDIFTKGFFRMVMVHKWPFFQLFFRKYRPEKCLLRYSRVGKFLSRL